MARTLSGGEGLSLPLPARHLPEGTLGSERHEHGAALVCVGVEEEGFREVLAVEVAGSEKGGPTLRCFEGSSTTSFRGCVS